MTEKQKAGGKKKDSAAKPKNTKPKTAKAAPAKTVQPAKRKESTAEKKRFQKLSEKLLSLLPLLEADEIETVIEQAEFFLASRRKMELEKELSAYYAEENKRLQKQKETEKGFKILRGSDGEVYNIVYCGKWKTFNANELFELIRIAQQNEEYGKIKGEIYHWMFRERSDFLSDFSLSGADNPAWDEFIYILQKNFKLSL